MKHFSIKFKHTFEAPVPISTHSCPDAINSNDLFSFLFCDSIDTLVIGHVLQRSWWHFWSFNVWSVDFYIKARWSFFKWKFFFPLKRFTDSLQLHSIMLLVFFVFDINIFWYEILHFAWFESDLHISMFSVGENVLQTSAANWLVEWDCSRRCSLRRSMLKKIVPP